MSYWALLSIVVKCTFLAPGVQILSDNPYISKP